MIPSVLEVSRSAGAPASARPATAVASSMRRHLWCAWRRTRGGGKQVDTRRTGRIFGWFFIGTFITSIPARLLFIHGLDTSWTDTVFHPGAVSDTSLKFGAILEFGVIATNIATA